MANKLTIWVNNTVLLRVVRKEPLLIVRDFVLLAGAILIAVVFAWIGISGLTADGGEPRVLVTSLFCLLVALGAAYLAVGAIALWLLEWLRLDRPSEK